MKCPTPTESIGVDVSTFSNAGICVSCIIKVCVCEITGNSIELINSFKLLEV